MAFGKKNVASRCSDSKNNSLLVWNKETIDILNQWKGSINKKSTPSGFIPVAIVL